MRVDLAIGLNERHAYVGHGMRPAIEKMLLDQVQSRLVVLRPRWSEVEHVYCRGLDVLRVGVRRGLIPNSPVVRNLVSRAQDDLERRREHPGEFGPIDILVTDMEIHPKPV